MADISSITKLREQTGAGILECKNALDDVKGDFEKALEIIRKGIAKAAKEQRTTAEGEGLRYIHTNGWGAGRVEL